MNGFSESRHLALPAAPTITQRTCRRLFHRVLSSLTSGRVTFHDLGDRVSFGTPSIDGLDVHVQIHDRSFYQAALLEGSAGVGRSYMEGAWSCADLGGLIRIFARNGQALSRWSRGLQRVLLPAQRAWLWSHRNSRAGSRRNISEHYDLGNEFFSTFLDSRMMYSSAFYESDSSTLEEASAAKLRRVCRKLDLSPNDRVLEIGSGWGGFALLAAEEFGCHVTTITISQAQFEHATALVETRGLGGRVDVRLCDYRDVDGVYDKIVSIEMIEAVGAAHMDTYARVCGRRLAPNGRLLLQAIIIDERAYESALRQVDFIKKYIFPGSFIPSSGRIHDAIARTTDLRPTQVEDLTAHYARTLSDWHDRFLASSDRIRELGFDDAFLRRWRFYFKYCEGGFEERRIGVQQLVFSKPFDRDLVAHGTTECLS